MPSESELEAAIERLLDAERFAAAEQVVAQAAPQLQKVLVAALAEEARMGMMVGVAVGWALNEELRTPVERDDPRPPGDEARRPDQGDT